VASPTLVVTGTPTSSEIDLTAHWSGSVAFVSMTLQRSAVGPAGPWTTIQTFLTPAPPVYHDTGLSASTQYWYQAYVTAFALGNSGATGTTATTAAAAGTHVKWNPGHWMGSGNFITSGPGPSTSGRTTSAAELTQLAGFQNVNGYKMYLTWGAVQQASGVYDFGAVYATLAALKAMTSAAHPEGKHLIVCIMSNRFNGNEPPDMPSYILNSSAYGSSPLGGSYGWWIYSGNGSAACFHRSAVATEWGKMLAHMLSDINPDTGMSLNDDPNFEGLVFQENNWDIGSVSPAPDFDENTWKNNLTSMFATQVIPAASKTNVWYQQTWLLTPTNSQQWFTDLFAVRVMCGTSDTWGYSTTQHGGSSIPFGVSAYKAIVVPGSSWTPGPDYSSNAHHSTFYCDVEDGDIGAGDKFGYTFEDCLQACNLTYSGTHLVWTNMSDGFGPFYNPYDGTTGNAHSPMQWGSPGSGQLGDKANNPANAVALTSYPLNYP